MNADTKTYEAIYKYRDDYRVVTAFDLEQILVTVTDDDGGSSTVQTSVESEQPGPEGFLRA